MSSGRGGGGGGRGEYYRNKYGAGGGGRGGGRGGRGRAPGGDIGGESVDGRRGVGSAGPGGGGSYQDLQRLLEQIDGRQYPSYHDLETPHGSTSTGWTKHHEADQKFVLFVGRAQSDPFAPPTRCRIVVPAAVAQIPPALCESRIQRLAAADFLLRTLHHECKSMGADHALSRNHDGDGGGRGGSGSSWSGPKGGDVQVLQPTQHVLEQSAVQITATGDVYAQVTINLPARGRTILGRAAWQILNQVLPCLVQRALCFPALQQLPHASLASHVRSIQDQAWLQSQLEASGLVAFVCNGAILPRVSGVEEYPLQNEHAVPFSSPPSLQVSFTLPHSGRVVTGMGIARGVTLICGGGFHGKSTLLQTIQLGVYFKIPGDGREFCVTSPSAIKIRAEDGRNVQAVDISTMINNLPFSKDTTCFSTSDASGSTSQASNIVESIELGAQVLLVDEDTCATNFMIRDSKMMQLVAAEKEPITPFVRLVRSLHEHCNISCIMVIGGLGDYFHVADSVLVMDSYKCLDATDRAMEIVWAAAASNNDATSRQQEDVSFQAIRNRHVVVNKLDPAGKVKTLRKGIISYGETEIDLTSVEQIISASQTSAIASCLQKLASNNTNNSNAALSLCLRDQLQALDRALDQHGLDILAPGQCNGGLTRPRLLEVAAAVNRIRRDGAVVQLNNIK